MEPNVPVKGPVPNKRDSVSMWRDPDRRTHAGVLLSDRIRFYVEEVGLIAPFAQSKLRAQLFCLVSNCHWLG